MKCRPLSWSRAIIEKKKPSFQIYIFIFLCGLGLCQACAQEILPKECAAEIGSWGGTRGLPPPVYLSLLPTAAWSCFLPLRAVIPSRLQLCLLVFPQSQKQTHCALSNASTSWLACSPPRSRSQPHGFAELFSQLDFFSEVLGQLFYLLKGWFASSEVFPPNFSDTKLLRCLDLNSVVSPPQDSKFRGSKLSSLFPQPWGGEVIQVITVSVAFSFGIL